jgi:predicted TIM-barrel fold metal-dependent hydrolase
MDVLRLRRLGRTRTVERDVEEAMSVLITDSQVHVWPRETPDRPWSEERRQHAHGPAAYTVEELRGDMAAAGVDRAILVPSLAEGDRND